MSFRTRLSLFFVAIVIVPMVSLTLVLYRLTEDNRTGKSDVRVASAQQVAVNLFREDRATALELSERVGRDMRLGTALRRGDAAAARRRAQELLGTLGLVRIRIEGPDPLPVDAGRRDAIAPAGRRLMDADGADFGRLEVSDRSADVFARQIRRLTGLDVVVRLGGRQIGGTRTGLPDRPIPRKAVTVGIAGEEYRAAAFPIDGFAGSEGDVVVLGARAVLEDTETEEGIEFVYIALILAGFFLLALFCAYLVRRSLQAQIGAFLEAARRLGRGDFSAEVPTQGRDEFAALGQEFTQMARQLEGRLEELKQERARLETSLRDLGEAFASNLDRTALLALAVRSATDGVEADGGRAVLRDQGEAARTGDLGDLEALVTRLEREALAGDRPSEAGDEAGAALVHPLPAAADGSVLGVLSVWRRERPFDAAERDLFHYLAGQAAVSLDNVALHEAVQRQAVTDELTGLFNHRRFQEALASEIERARRFDQPVALVMLDIDNFKQVNDTYGHQVGDRVLAEVARVLRDESRELDEPARYGGEELAVVLPGTDLDGAFNLAERVRAGIEALRIAVDRDGTRPLKVTASFGAAAVPSTAHDQQSLIAAADTALYVAKRSGKNRTARAEAEGARPGQ